MRPLHISDKQIESWEQALTNNNLIPVAFKESDTLKEIMFAGFWLQENLRLLGCSDGLIVQIQFTHGHLSYKRDAWEVAAELLEAFKKNELDILVDAEVVEQEMEKVITAAETLTLEPASIVEETTDEHVVDPKMLN